jgi:hypothetical protein
MIWKTTLMLLAAAAIAAPAAAQETTQPAAAAGMVPLKLKLPKPLFVGTPKNIKVENLEPATGKERAPMMVPDGVENVALEKEVTSSDNEPTIGELELITDGDKEAADGSYVELGQGVQWVQIDLKEATEIYAIVVWHYHQQARVYHDVVVRVADDADFISNVQTVFNNDNDNSAKLGVGQDRPYLETYEGKLIDAKGVKGRYVRLYSNGNTANEQNHYIEVEVYGKPAK